MPDKFKHNIPPYPATHPLTHPCLPHNISLTECQVSSASCHLDAQQEGKPRHSGPDDLRGTLEGVECIKKEQEVVKR